MVASGASVAQWIENVGRAGGVGGNDADAAAGVGSGSADDILCTLDVGFLFARLAGTVAGVGMDSRTRRLFGGRTGRHRPSARDVVAADGSFLWRG